MDSYKVELTKRAEKEIQRIDRRYIARILETIEGLAEEPHPHGSTKLVGTDNTYRIRIGDYRIVYEVFENRLLVVVIRVRHRKNVYD